MLNVAAVSPYQSSVGFQIPFESMKLVYYSETMPVLQQQTGLTAAGWVSFLFHNVTSSSAQLSIVANGTVANSNNQLPIQLSSVIVYPTNEDTILFLRNGGQQNLTIYAGPVGQAIQIIPNYNLQLTGQWDLHDQSVLSNQLGSFSTYRYHRSISLGNTILDIYASYDKVTQLLLYGEVYASQHGLSELIEKTTLRQTNEQFTTSTPSTSKCVIATAAYGSELAGPVQFLRDFRDDQVARTYLGRSFLYAFNTWYYSWAPSVARAEYGNSHLRAGVRVAILPLLGGLRVSDSAFNLIYPANPELAVLMTGLLASSLLGLVYLTPFALVVKIFWKGRITSRTLLYAAVVALTLALLGTVGLGTVGFAEILTALVVVETAILTPLVITVALAADFAGCHKAS
jgi:peptide/nickel transport system substrate-binding protein